MFAYLSHLLGINLIIDKLGALKVPPTHCPINRYSKQYKYAKDM